MNKFIGYQIVRRYATLTAFQLIALQSVIDTAYLVANGFNHGRIEIVQFVIHNLF